MGIDKRHPDTNVHGIGPDTDGGPNPLYRAPDTQVAPSPPPLTEVDVLHYRLRGYEARFNATVAILTAIHSVMKPDRVELPDGRVFEFSNPAIEREMLTALCERIRAIPDELERIPAPSPPVAPDSLVARLREHPTGTMVAEFKDFRDPLRLEAADRIEQLQRDNTELLRETTVTAYRKLESRLERVTQAAATLVAWANKDSSQGSPDHCHSVPGIWDNDSGNARVGKAGKPCAECAMWDNARDAIRAEKDS